MAKQLNVNLAFTADTSQAKKQLQDLQNQLTKLGSVNFMDKNSLTKDFNEAANTIAKLKVQLEQSTNPVTGLLDLGKFKKELDSGGLDLFQYKAKLESLGPAGEKAFNSLTSAIMSAEMPLKRTNQVLDQFWTTLKNTARWQLSSSALHSMMGAIQGAYGYAQDLNKSLTSIAIVTHNSVDGMRDFAAQANKAAQALSTSTLAYTDAALIYYQQGLNSEEVAARTETTLKMSNVTGESAEEVSSYMTAIWNNFRTGSESIESFADKITALGAATASSSAEIAGGLQQFAAVANTVGLSYDYAATALATVVAQTRQSESTVGNAFRNIFSRLEGLQMGETLEDGTDLNKYSNALATIGVNIKEQNGDLKAMDTILEEVGAKWQTLSRDQQMALAQTIGGVRQYANLIALFDNWDQFQENLQVSRNAQGELETQAQIYAESWEAAKKRVLAAWQEIYQQLIDDKFFITILNSTKEILNNVSAIIQALGGLPGVLSTVLGIVLKIGKNDITKGLQDFGYNFLIPNSVKDYEQRQLQEQALLASKSDVLPADADEYAVAVYKQRESEYNITKEIYKYRALLTEQEQKELGILNDQKTVLYEQYQNLVKQKQELEGKQASAGARIAEEAFAGYKAIKEANNVEGINATNFLRGNAVGKTLDNKGNTGSYLKTFESFDNALNKAIQSKLNYEKVGGQITATYINTANEAFKAEERLAHMYGVSKEAIKAYKDAVEERIRKQNELTTSLETLESKDASIIQRIHAMANASRAFSGNIVDVVQTLNSLVMAANAFKGIFETIQNPDLTFWQKFTAVITSLTIVLRALTSIKLKDTFDSIKNTVSLMANTAARIANEKAARKQTQAVQENSNAVKRNTADNTGNSIAQSARTWKDRWKDVKGGWSLAKNGGGVAEGEALNGAQSLGYLLNSLLPYLATLAAIAAAIWAIDKAIVTAKERAAMANKELDNSQKLLDNISKSVDKARSNYDNLNQALEKFDEKAETIQKLDHNTAEWRQSIIEANAELIDMVSSLNMLDKVNIQYRDGLAYLTDSDKELLQLESERQLNLAQLNKTIAQIDVVQKQQKVGITDSFNKTRQKNLTNNDSLLTGSYDFVKLIDRAYDGLKEQYKFFPGESDFERFSAAAEKLAETNAVGWDEEKLSEAFQNLEDNPELKSIAGIMPELATDSKLISAIQEAARTIVAGNTTEDAYKTQFGQQVATQLGLNVPGFAQKAAYGQLGNAFYDEAWISKTTEFAKDLKENPWSNQEFLSPYLDSLGMSLDASGNVTQNGAVVDNFSWEEAARYILVAKAQEQMAEAGLTQEQRDSLNATIAEQRKTVQDEIAKYIKELLDFSFDTTQLSDAELDAGINIPETDAKYLQNPDDLSAYLKEQASLKNDTYDNPDLQADQLTQYKSTKAGIADLDEDVQELTQHLRDHADQIEGVAENLKLCERDARDLAEAIIRFDDAIVDVTENYEDWMDALKIGEKSPQRLEEAIEGVRIAYANLLDIDGSYLSDEFLSSAENLEKMKTAISGSGEEAEKAYNELVKLSSIDYLKSIDHIELDNTVLNNITNYVNQVEAEFERLNGPIVIGENIDDGPLRQALTAIINNLNLTATEAEKYLDSLNYTATVVPGDYTEEEKQEMMDLIPVPSDTVQVSTGMLASDGGVTQNTITAQGIKYKGERHHEKNVKQTKVHGLRIDTLKKKGSGGVKFEQAKHGGGGVSPSKSSGGGGGGGGGSKKKTVKEHTKLEKAEDRYHNIKSAINEVSKALDRLNKLQDRAYGKAKLKYMDQEIAKLEEQVKLTDMYIDEAKKYLALDRGKLEGTGMGAIFTDEGRLLNYEQVLQNIIGSYNGAIDAYNGAIDQFNASAQEDADNQMLDNAKKQLDNAKEIYDNNKQILKQYEDTYSTLQEQMDKRVDLLNQIYDAKLAKVKWKVDIQLEVNDADLEVLDWINKYIQKDSKKAADSIANLSKQMGLFGKNITVVNGGLDELFENHGIKNYEDLTAEQLVDRLRSWQNAEGLGSEITQAEADQIREWMTALMGYADDMLEAFEEAHEQVDKALDSWNDKLDEQIQKFDDLRDFLDSYNDIINLTGQRMLGMSDQDLADIDRSIVSNSQNRLESLRRIMEENQTNLNRMRAVDTSGYTEDALREWEENIKHAEEVATESTKNYWDGFKQSLEDGETAYNNAMDRMAAQYKRTLGNLDFLSERFSRQQEVDHLYLDDYEKYNAINKDMAELSKNLEKTNNLALKSKIKDFQDELNDAMSTGVRISQRQADIYERRVALLQAEAELLNAQNAKSAVRMTRDNEGNFSYTYTADQDAIDAAEENYSTSFYDYLKYMRDNQEELQNEQIQKMSQYMDDLTALYQAFYDGEITDLDAALAELNAQYDEYREYFIDQETMLFDEMGRLRDEDWEFAQEITGLKLAEEDDFITDFSDTLVGRLEPTYQTAEGWAMEWAEAIADSNTSARESLNLWYQDVNTTYKAAGTTVDNFRDLVKADLTAINQASNDTKTATDQMAIAMDNDMNNVIKKAVDMDRYWSTVMNDVRNQIEATVLKMNDMLRQLANIEDYEYRAGTGAQVAQGAFAGMGDAASAAVGPLNDMAGALNNAADAARNLRDALNNDNPPEETKKPRGVGVWGNEISNTANGHFMQAVHWSNGDVSYERVSRQHAANSPYIANSLATGGYTGAWGPEGKWALLHEKELVLNKEDTANILSVVDTVRGLANNFDISNGLNQFAKSILNSSQLAMAGIGSLDQNVHIEANFPNVESHNEIEMALNNLINSASQYVNRK